MWNDIIIGKGDKGCTAHLLRNLDNGGHISDNHVSFWISGAFLDTGITIFKNTDEGKELQRLLTAPGVGERVEDWVDKLVLTKLSPKKMKEQIAKAMQKSFESGREYQAAEIRKSLMI